MQPSDGVPEAISELFRTSKTVELCGKPLDGLRCMRKKEHDGMHEWLGQSGPKRWG